MKAKIFSAAVNGLTASLVEVEADIGRSLPSFQIVGLPDSAVKEARERVRAAIRNSQLQFPVTRVTVNLAPGDVPKIGPAFDLAVALAIILSAEQIKCSTDSLANVLFIGELGLDGTLRPVAGALSAALLAERAGFKFMIVPQANACEAALVEGLTILPATCLLDVVRHMLEEIILEPSPMTVVNSEDSRGAVDLAHVKGQTIAKRALEVAAAGGHNIRLTGPPGVGKTMLARTLLGILPPLTRAEVLEATAIHSAAGLLDERSYVATHPFRSPHHTTSYVALVGGGTRPRPGEVSLAHRGVLFLDEFPEFPRRSLEALRQPLEDGVVTVARAAGQAMFPARFTLVTAENPCPCGFRYDKTKACSCSAGEIQRYDRRLSGPLIDRIDIHVTVPRVELTDLVSPKIAETSVAVRARVCQARLRQKERLKNSLALTNDEMTSHEVDKLVELTGSAKNLLYQAIDKLKLSARSYTRLLKISRTIADLDNQSVVLDRHLAEALQYRPEASGR